jgi:hypothetical protein
VGEKYERRDDDQITFTLGQGNHSSICGGVTPMGIDDQQNATDVHQTDAENPVGVGGELRPGADAKAQLP